MGVTADFVCHGLNIASASTFLSQISNFSVNTQQTLMQGVPAGFPYPLFIYNLTQLPDFTFDCEQIKSVLDITGTQLGDISSGNTDAYFRAVANKASRTSSASTAHVRMRSAEAVLAPLSLRASNDQPASMSLRCVCLYDGTNEPFVAAASVALAGTPTSAEHFVVGPVSINSTPLNGVQDISIDFGNRFIERRADGELYITYFAIQEQRPVITINTLTAAMPTFGLNGTALTGLSLWLRKCGPTARVANGTAEHILFEATSGFISTTSMSGGGNNEAITTIRLELSAPDTSTAPLTVDTTAAIS